MTCRHLDKMEVDNASKQHGHRGLLMLLLLVDNRLLLFSFWILIFVLESGEAGRREIEQASGRREDRFLVTKQK